MLNRFCPLSKTPYNPPPPTPTPSYCFILAFTLGSIDKKLLSCLADFGCSGCVCVCVYGGGGGGAVGRGGGLSESVEKIKMMKIFFTDNIQ